MEQHSNNDIISLSQNMHGMVYKCNCCQNIHFTYKNVFLILTKKDMYSLKKCLQKLKPENFNIFHPHGNVALINSKNNAYKLGFTSQEVKEVCWLIQEAELMLDIYQALE